MIKKKNRKEQRNKEQNIYELENKFENNDLVGKVTKNTTLTTKKFNPTN
jgi:hypothetical protein